MTILPSPGNEFFPDTPPMRQPCLEFLYRLECDMYLEDVEVGAPHGIGYERSIGIIKGGTVKGPRLEGKILGHGGADWAKVVKGTHSMMLDARYTVKTNDGQYLYIRAKGLYRPGPRTEYSRSDFSQRTPSTVTQDDVEFFSHLRIEAGDGKYNYLNGLVILGVMTCVDERICIDAYYLTNFPGVEPEDVKVREY